MESCFNKSSLNLNSVPTRFRMVGKGSPGFNGISGGSSPTNVNNKQIKHETTHEINTKQSTKQARNNKRKQARNNQRNKHETTNETSTKRQTKQTQNNKRNKYETQQTKQFKSMK